VTVLARGVRLGGGKVKPRQAMRPISYRRSSVLVLVLVLVLGVSSEHEDVHEHEHGLSEQHRA
jgi:hypothetical protein